jgi:hypothetical protein
MRKLIALTTAVILATVIPLGNYVKAPSADQGPVIARDNYVHEDGWAASVKPIPWSITAPATWYDATKNNAWYTRANKWGKSIKFYVAAGPALREYIPTKWRMKPVAVKITSLKTGKSVIAYVVDWCSCWGVVKNPNDNRVADLAPAIWNALGVRLGVGVTKVRIELAP